LRVGATGAELPGLFGQPQETRQKQGGETVFRYEGFILRLDASSALFRECGKDDTDNLEITDVSVYVEICGQLRNQVKHMRDGQKIGSITIE